MPWLPIFRLSVTPPYRPTRGEGVTRPLFPRPSRKKEAGESWLGKYRRPDWLWSYVVIRPPDIRKAKRNECF